MAVPGLHRQILNSTEHDMSDWRVQLLTRIGAPITSTNLTALQAWALSESGYNSTYGTNLAGPMAYNPLAITDGYGVPYVSSINSDGVKAFGSTQSGVEATALFFQHGYGDIIQALRDSDPVALFSAVNQSGWCSGCEGGHYPVGLYGYLSGGQVQGGGAKFKGSFGGGAAGAANSGGGAGSGSGKATTDTGGLYGSCRVTTSSVPFASFSIPTGGFSCYLLQSLKFGGLAAGGGILMLVGLGLVVAPSLLGKVGMAAPVGFVNGLDAVAGLREGSTSSTATEEPEEPAEEPSGPSVSEQREARLQKERAASLRIKRARAREAEARAREAERRAPTGRQRIAAAGRGEVLAAGPVAGALA